MERTELLEALLEVSSDHESTKSISEELPKYFDVLSGVIVESVRTVSPVNLASDRMVELAIKCLVNFCADNSLCRQLFAISKPERRSALIKCLVTLGFLMETGSSVSDYSISLLVNLTIVDDWSQIFFTASYKSAVYRKIASKREPSASELKFLLNLTTNLDMRQYMCNESAGISSLASLLREMDSECCRLTIAGLLKNCCFEERHSNIISFDMSHLVVVLCGPEDKIDPQHRDNLAPLLREAYETKSAKRETSVAVKFAICEALLQTCSTENGRSYLRSLGAYFVLRELHRYECDQESMIDAKTDAGRLAEQKMLVFNIEQVVDQLICEEYERPPGQKSLRDVQIDEKTQKQLDDARTDFLKCN